MTTIISTVEGDIIAVGDAAWTQTKTELQTLETTVLADIKVAIDAAIKKLESGASIEDIETEVLGALENSVPALIGALSSGAMQVLIAMAKTAASEI